MFRRLEVAISMVYSKTAGKDVPMLSAIDDGHGMSHADIQRMISFGHGQPAADDPDHIGRYGIGFKVFSILLQLVLYSASVDMHTNFH